jgi:cobalt-precorrin 5A hydrolase/precorrin-3B C17-methyltransferase
MTDLNGPIFLGLGCSTAASADEIVRLIKTCLAEADCHPGQITAVASHKRKTGSQPLLSAADHFSVPIFFLDDAALPPGIVGTCEAVAAAAGPLLLPKRKSRFATCAIARCTPDFTIERFRQPANPRAAIAPSTLATSVAGP